MVGELDVIPVLSLGSLAPVPPDALLTLLEQQVTPGGSSKLSILPGSSVSGSRVAFTDLNGLTAYSVKSGWDMRGARGQRISRYMTGLEDSDKRRQS